VSALDAQLALLPERLGFHLALVLLSLTVGVALSVPLALLIVLRQTLRTIVLGVAGVAQTIPSLALLALMVPLLDLLRRGLGATFPAFGFLPAALALVLYSMLPVLRNSVTGLAGVEASVVEAATGLGLTRAQVLLRVQLPLAAPVILAGVRTSAVWTVGTATLSTPVGQTSLGNYIFAGLQTRDWTAVLVGCVATAVLALVLDAALGQLERAAATRRRGPAVLGALVLAALVVLTAVLVPARRPGARAVVRIGAKNFTEQYVLAEALALSVRARGFEAEVVEGLGSTVLFDAVAHGDVDVAIDYSGTLWASQLKRTDVLGRAEVLGELTTWLDTQTGVACLGSLGFENTYAFALRADRAQQLALRSLDDLAAPLRGWRLGSDYEFFSRPEWRRVAERYQLEPREKVSFDPSLMYAAVQSGEVQVITAFSTDGRLSAYGLTVLTDPRQGFPPYDAVLLVSPRARRNEALVAALRGLIGAIDADQMRHANQLVDVEGKSRAEAARALLRAVTDGGW
jgi:osmoprotectant transport system permease protein